MGEFLVHSSVVWLNPLPSLGRLRKEPELTLFGGLRRSDHDVRLQHRKTVNVNSVFRPSVFKRAVILVYRESTKLKKRMVSLLSPLTFIRAK